MNRALPGKIECRGGMPEQRPTASGSMDKGRSIAVWHYYSDTFYHLDKSAVKKGGDS
jgi:hypothetical protein